MAAKEAMCKKNMGGLLLLLLLVLLPLWCCVFPTPRSRGVFVFGAGPRRASLRAHPPPTHPPSPLFFPKTKRKKNAHPVAADINQIPYPTQTACCNEAPGCSNSGGPGARTCWAPDFAAKKCVMWRLDDPNAKCDTGLKHGFQLQRICETESFGAGNAVQNKMAPVAADKTAVAPAVVNNKMAVATDDKKAKATFDVKADMDLTGGSADIAAKSGSAFTQVCNGRQAVAAACAKTKGCVGFVMESKDVNNNAGCGYLKKAGGSMVSRRGWTVFVRIN
jgi:hypothetical protein